jgi:hypothetical protein
MEKTHPQAPYSKGDFNNKDESIFSGENRLLEVPSDARPTTAGTRGSANQMFKEALGEIQGIMQLIGSLDLKTLLAEKEKPDPGPDPSPTPSPGFNHVAVTKNGDETTTRLVGDALVYQEEREGSRSAASEVNDPKNPGETTTKGSTLENAIVSNTKTTFFDEGKKVLTAETPENPKTSIIFDPSSDISSFAFTLPLINKLITHLSRTFVSAQPNQGQYIHLIGRDMDINGIKLKVIPYINLNYLKGGGQEIILDNGITVRIHNQKIHSSSLLKEIRINIDELSNKLDPNNGYIVISDEELKGIIKSKNGIFYMTDDTENIKNGPYTKLMINRARLEMFS